MSEAPAPWVELERHAERRSAQERVLVLQSVGIPHGLVELPDAFVLIVHASDVGRASAELERYARENQGWPPREERYAPLPGGPSSALVYCAVLLAVYLAQVNRSYGFDWTALGRAHAARIQAGEWWRAVTALSLHADLAHVAGNAVFGAFFGVLLSQVVGTGVAWASILAAGALGNLLNAWLQSPDHVSIGASTAVFGAVGCLAAHRWATRRSPRPTGRRRWLALVMGVALLGFLGFPQDLPDEFTTPRGPAVDVLAHATGFLAGLALGALHPVWQRRWKPSAIQDAALAWLVLAALAGAWALALA